MNHQPFPIAIASAIANYRNINGKDPGGLLLGYGTYFALCHELTEFYQIPITIDPDQEYRITLLSPGNCWEVAVKAVGRRLKTELDAAKETLSNPTSYAIREDVKRDLAITKHSRPGDEKFSIGDWIGQG